jgi:hypothetical protein
MEMDRRPTGCDLLDGSLQLFADDLAQHIFLGLVPIPHMLALRFINQQRNLASRHGPEPQAGG